MPPSASSITQGQGKYQYGWGDSSTNFTHHIPHTVTLREDKISAATSISSKGSNTVVVGLSIGLSLALCLISSLGLLYLHIRQMKMAEAAFSSKSIEKHSGFWHYPFGVLALSNISATYSIPSTIRIRLANSIRRPTISIYRWAITIVRRISSQKGLQD